MTDQFTTPRIDPKDIQLYVGGQLQWIYPDILEYDPIIFYGEINSIEIGLTNERQEVSVLLNRSASLDSNREFQEEINQGNIGPWNLSVATLIWAHQGQLYLFSDQGDVWILYPPNKPWIDPETIVPYKPTPTE